MPGYWIRAMRLTSCTSISCDRSMVRDEPIYLAAGVERNAVCVPCAMRRFQRSVPEQLPHLPPIVARVTTPPASQRLPLSDAHERSRPGALERFEAARQQGDVRKALARVKRELHDANAGDVRLKQLGKDA
jgi:hypothetical protein